MVLLANIEGIHSEEDRIDFLNFKNKLYLQQVYTQNKNIQYCQCYTQALLFFLACFPAFFIHSNPRAISVIHPCVLLSTTVSFLERCTEQGPVESVHCHTSIYANPILIPLLLLLINSPHTTCMATVLPKTERDCSVVNTARYIMQTSLPATL